MHALQPKHTKLKNIEVKKLLLKYNINLTQLPKIKMDDPAISKDCVRGDVIKIEREDEDKIQTFYRVVV